MTGSNSISVGFTVSEPMICHTMHTPSGTRYIPVAPLDSVGPNFSMASIKTEVKDNSGYNRETERTIKQARNGINLSERFTDVKSLMKDLEHPRAYAVLQISYSTSFQDPISKFVNTDVAEEWGFYLTMPNHLMNSTVLHYHEDDFDGLINKVESIIHGFTGAIYSDEGKSMVMEFFDHFIHSLKDKGSEFEYPFCEGYFNMPHVVSGESAPFPGDIRFSFTWGDFVTEVNI